MPLDAKDFIGPIITILAVGVGIWQYRTTSNSDFIKPVRETQLKLYQDASSAAAGIATLPPGTPEWTKSRQEFLRLFYGPLAIVEDFHHGSSEPGGDLTVEMAMIIFKSCLDDDAGCKAAGGNPLNLSLALAHTCRHSLGKSWGYAVKQLQGDYQNLAKSYWETYQKNRRSNRPPENDGGKQKP